MTDIGAIARRPRSCNTPTSTAGVCPASETMFSHTGKLLFSLLMLLLVTSQSFAFAIEDKSGCSMARFSTADCLIVNQATPQELSGTLCLSDGQCIDLNCQHAHCSGTGGALLLTLRFFPEHPCPEAFVWLKDKPGTQPIFPLYRPPKSAAHRYSGFESF